MILVRSSLAFGVFGVKHRPKGIARTEERVGAVAVQTWSSMEIFLTILIYILIFILTDKW